jgi:murein DD-endopeptidase MepM/ murein hydrolase activator NlpD
VGSSVTAAAAGKLYASGQSLSYGNFVYIKHNDGSYTFYAHLQHNNTKAVGTPFSAGEAFATSGNTGLKRLDDGTMVPHSPHLHFESIRADAPVPSGINLGGTGLSGGHYQ